MSAVLALKIETPTRRLAREFFHDPVATGAFAVLLLIVFFAVFAPLLAPQNPYDLAKVTVMDARLEPGERNTYLEVATVYWDYYQFDQAVRVFKELRNVTGDQTIYAYRLGAVYEGKGDLDSAIAEYVKLLAEPGEGRVGPPEALAAPEIGEAGIDPHPRPGGDEQGVCPGDRLGRSIEAGFQVGHGGTPIRGRRIASRRPIL